MDYAKYMRRLVLILAAALALAAAPCYSQTGPAGSDSGLPAGTPPTVSEGGKGPTVLAPTPGSIAEALSRFLSQFSSFRTGLIGGATSLSDTLTPEAGKIASGLGILTLTLAGLRFAGTSDPTVAWTDLLETLLIISIFSSLFVGYTTFAPGIFEWFQSLADKISGTRASNPGLVLASVAGSFFDSFTKALAAAKWYEVLSVAFAGVLLIMAFVMCAIAAVLYAFFIALGEIQVAIGIVVGPIAVALGFFDYSRRFFTSWLDFMIAGSMYMVVAAVMSKLVSSALVSTLPDVQAVGYDAPSSAAYVCGIAAMMILVALEIPKIAGSIFGSGSGVSGGGFMRLATKLATKGLK